MTKRADLRETRPLCLKSLKSDVPSAAMRKRAEVGLETVLYKLVHFAVVILGWKRCFVQTRTLSLKALRISALSAKITKRAYLGLKTLFCKNSHTFVKTAKNVLRPVRKLQNVLISGLKLPFCTNLCTLLKIAKKWCARCENDKTCCSRDENSVLHKLLHFAKNG